MKFFARIRPDGDVLPIRAEFNDDDVTKNIGLNYFTDSESVWLSGPDVIASKLLAGKIPHIEKAIGIVPRGQQKGLKPTNLRGMVEIDPRNDDLFRVMVEEKQVQKPLNEALSYFLKICANSTSYGMFYELTPQKRFNPVKVKVFSGEHSHEQFVTTIEKPGEWYFPPIAALITGGAHLLLAMLERCITDKGGHFLFCDTDSMCIVASRTGGWVGCPNEPRIKALSWEDVKEITKRFGSLNCYDRTKVRGSILKIEKVNFNNNKQIELFGYAISAKRSDLYRYDAQGNIVIVDAKAHGLGYLYPQTSIAGRRVDHITRDHIALLVVGSSPANTNNALRTLRRMLKKAHEWEMIRSVPVVKLVEEHGREELIEPWMEANLLAVTEIPRTPNSKHAPKSINYGWQPFRDVLLIMLDTGMRPAEVFRMRWEHMKWERELIFVPRSKSRKSKRFVGITERVRAALLARKTNANEGWVFPSARAESGHLETVQKQFERARRMAGLPESVVLYSARHRFSTDAMEGTGNLMAVMDAMGHEKIDTTRLYNHPGTKQIRDAIERRNQLVQ